MQGLPDQAWGKLRRVDGADTTPAWHPLVDHCADVAATLEALLSRSLMGGRLFALAGLDPDDERLIQRLGAIAFLHDIGKANRGFQNKRLLPPGARAARGIDVAGHVGELYPLLFDENEETLRRRLAEALSLEDMGGWVAGDALLPLLVAAVSHHGTPWNCNDPFRCAHLWERGPTAMIRSTLWPRSGSVSNRGFRWRPAGRGSFARFRAIPACVCRHRHAGGLARLPHRLLSIQWGGRR